MFSHSISIAINASLTKEPIFIGNKDPKVLIEEIMKELTRRQELISEEVWKMYLIVDEESLLERVQGRWINWVNQVPVYGFNSRKYDLNMAKYYFVKTISDVNNINIEKVLRTCS